VTTNRALVVVALVTAGSCRSSNTAPLVIGAPVREYALTTRIEDGGETRTEQLVVRRPFASRIVLHQGERRTALGRLATRSSSEWTVLEVPPAGAGSDLRPDIALSAAVRRHIVQRRGQRTVAGRRCQIYRAAAPVSAGALVGMVPTPARHTDFCVGRGAIVLEQTDVERGRVVRHLRATRVRTGASTPDVLAIPTVDSLPVAAGGGRTRPISVAARPAFDRFYALPDPPRGFAAVGRFAVAPPALAGATSLVADVYVDGADFVIVDQGATSGGPVPFDTGRPTSTVELGELGQAEVVLDLRANEVRVRLPDNGFLRVIGTRPPADLVALARQLRLVPKSEPEAKPEGDRANQEVA